MAHSAIQIDQHVINELIQRGNIFDYMNITKALRYLHRTGALPDPRVLHDAEFEFNWHKHIVSPISINQIIVTAWCTPHGNIIRLHRSPLDAWNTWVDFDDNYFEEDEDIDAALLLVIDVTQSQQMEDVDKWWGVVCDHFNADDAYGCHDLELVSIEQWQSFIKELETIKRSFNLKAAIQHSPQLSNRVSTMLSTPNASYAPMPPYQAPYQRVNNYEQRNDYSDMQQLSPQWQNMTPTAHNWQQAQPANNHFSGKPAYGGEKNETHSNSNTTPRGKNRSKGHNQQSKKGNKGNDKGNNKGNDKGNNKGSKQDDKQGPKEPFFSMKRISKILHEQPE